MPIFYIKMMKLQQPSHRQIQAIMAVIGAKITNYPVLCSRGICII